MNASIRPIKAILEEKYLYDGDSNYVGHWREVEVIGVSAYPGCFLTFHVLVDGKYIFSDIPIIALRVKSTVANAFDIDVLSYRRLSIGSIESFELPRLRENTAAIYLKTLDTFVFGTYVVSFDFYDENELLHLMILTDGQFILVPNHKINWSGSKELPNFRKNHTNWSK